MKNSGNKRMIKRKGKSKKGLWEKPCSDQMELRGDIVERSWNSGKRKDEASRTEKCDMLNNSGTQKLYHLDEQ